MKDLLANNQPVVQQETTYGLHYFQEVQSSSVHHFYISGDIGPANYYVEMIHIIRTAGPNDIVYIHLNTTGGVLDTGIQIINAMKESGALIICSIEAQAYSMGSMIFLAADDFIVHDNAMMMIHNFSGGSFGKGNEQRLRLDAVITLFDTFVRPIYVPFISEEEYDGVIDGKDIWLQSDQIRERLELVAKSRAEPEALPAPKKKRAPAKRKTPAKK